MADICGASKIQEFLAAQNQSSSGSPTQKRFEAASKRKILSAARKLYHPIHPWQTRILIIPPGTTEDQFECILEAVDLIAKHGVGIPSRSTVVQYEALSYSWGYPAFTAMVKCNGIDVPVTENLLEALRCLRSSNQERYVWIDAFCINQSDAEERSRQVRDILLIFAKAQRVLVWLGNMSNLELSACHLLASIPETTDTLCSVHGKDCFAENSVLHAALVEIMERPWFRRTWVRQEVFASKELTLQCRGFTVPFKQLVQVLYTRDHRQRLTFRCPEASLKALELLETCHDPLPSDYKYHDRELIHRMVILFGNALFEATDGRDRVYGLLGMLLSSTLTTPSKDSGSVMEEDTLNYTLDYNIPINYAVDYDKSLGEVYQDIILELVRRHKSLKPLHIFRDYTQPSPNMASWVTNLETCRLLGFRTGRRGEIHKWSASTKLSSKLRVRGRQLTVLERRFSADEQHPCGGKDSDRLEVRMEKDLMRYGLANPVSKDRPNAAFLESLSYTAFKTDMITSYDYILASSAARAGDLIVLLNGSDEFACLRKQPSSADEYIFLGPAIWVTSFRMDGNRVREYHWEKDEWGRWERNRLYCLV